MNSWTGRSVLVTGAEIAPEASALLESQACHVHYSGSYTSSTDLAELASRHLVEAMIVRSGKVTADVIRASPRLKVIAKHGSGVDNIDLEAASLSGIPVMRAVAANSQAVAEHAFALMATLVKDLRSLDGQVRAGEWPKAAYRGRDLAGAVLGLVGFGEIGRRLAAMAAAFRMPVLAYDPMLPAEFRDPNVRRVDDIDDLIGASDVISLHCPLTPGTRHLIDARRLAAMKRTAFLINTARGGIVDEGALVDALRSGSIAGAGLDSFEEEPPSADNPLWSIPNVVLTPHVAGVTHGSFREMGVQAARHVVAALDGHAPEPACIANPDYRNHATGAGHEQPALGRR